MSLPDRYVHVYVSVCAYVYMHESVYMHAPSLSCWRTHTHTHTHTPHTHTHHVYKRLPMGVLCISFDCFRCVSGECSFGIISSVAGPVWSVPGSVDSGAGTMSFVAFTSSALHPRSAHASGLTF